VTNGQYAKVLRNVKEKKIVLNTSASTSEMGSV